ncbi:outer membrane beta-barrel protein [Pedobacter deserti]|uniref:outer membrane beta-barrel protein n=1 Tax=Pedobacter deserti TaxID=2817382 RepID=UPI00210DA7B3|nr:outer membrane beta-barrel protein [Pedobacter sp. SYSU D00382]
MNHFFQTVRTVMALLLIGLSSSSLFAQVPAGKPSDPPPPLPFREISGIVKDSTDLGVIGATVSLTSEKDTLKTSTNSDGIFIFKNVKSATYTLVVQSIGFRATPPMRFKQNDLAPRIVMDPIVLSEEKNTLKEVVISGTPSITYKTDTVEYKASDYVVRKNASVDELLKKMEGMEVGNDGTLVHQGESVTRAKVNGKEFLGGDVANAIKNLPAEIVDKIQIVDDYGDQAARTGIKDGDAQKILNITTRTDKSVGNMANVNMAAGNNDRYEAGIFGTRINQNQQIGLNANYTNTVNGVNVNAGDMGGFGGGGFRGRRGNNPSASGGIGGNTKMGSTSFSIRDKVGSKIEYNLNYDFTRTSANSINASESLLNRSGSGSDTANTSLFTISNSNGDDDDKTHELRLETEINLDSNDFLRINPRLSYSSTSSLSDFRRSITGELNGQDNSRLETGSTGRSNTTPSLGLTVFYQHLFAKARRNFSAQAEISRNNNETAQTQDRLDSLYYLPVNQQQLLIDRIVARKNLRNNYRGSLTYAEPLSGNTQLEFNAQVNRNGYDNEAITSELNASGIPEVQADLSNIYKYSFTQGRLSVNFRYGMQNTSKVRFSLGVTGVPAQLSGTKASLGTSTNRTSFNVVPIARMEYLWSRQHRISFDYSGNATEPTFDQIQPVRDVSNPENPVLGNSDLKATFVHGLRARYDNYIANAKLNYSVNANLSFTDNAVVQNRVDTNNTINGKPVRVIETRFINMDGVYRVGGNYNISKQLSNRRYNLQLNGSVNYNRGVGISNGLENINRQLTIDQRFGPRINPADWFEINPHVSYTYSSSRNTVQAFIGNETKTLGLNLDGRVYFSETWLLGYNGSKRFISGLSSNINNDPFVVNAYLEKEVFNRRGRITFQAYDILNQNNVVSRNNTDFGYTDIRSNPVSRFFMLRLSMRLQKWSGAQGGRGGREIRRRGDGSFF